MPGTGDMPERQAEREIRLSVWRRIISCELLSFFSKMPQNLAVDPGAS
jgi:hypothetical protein